MAPSSSSPPAPGSTAAPAAFGHNRGIRFQIKTGNSRWTCTLQDRAAYERTKAARAGSVGSAASSTSS
ncbi:Uncharacterized protein TCAP_04033 [Tolypocladium capitatum]|uniref:Uncharacterized protein n=1 Tax=Tolypocladium capitatum TaxID=45235 RepID=A0A2K3QET6_9HYPO|nr:Uncharacterized protein TCAP_04033 [Tolypocladium capitatum]